MTKREKQLVEALRNMVQIAEISYITCREENNVKSARELLKQYEPKQEKPCQN